MNPLMGSLKLLTSPYLVRPDGLVSAGHQAGCEGDCACRCGRTLSSRRWMTKRTPLCGMTLFYGVRARYNCGFGDWRGAYGAQVG